MCKKNIIITIYLLAGCILFAQTIDLPYYNATYRQRSGFNRTKSSERSARKLQNPITLNGYLIVFNEDLGYFNRHPYDIIEQLNAQKKFGRDNWRIPTANELSVMEENAEKIGLGSGIYMCTAHDNGFLRPVSTDMEKKLPQEPTYPDCIKIGKTYWLKTNLGAKHSQDKGSIVSYEDAVKYCPQGYRLPTKEEYEELLALNGAYFEEISERCYSGDLYFPIRQVATFYMNETYRVSGDYFIQGNKYSLYFCKYCDAGYWTTHKPEISNVGLSKGMVKYVLDK